MTKFLLDISTESNSQLSSTELNFYWAFCSHFALSSSDKQSSMTATIAASFPPEMTKPRYNEKVFVHSYCINFLIEQQESEIPKNFYKGY